MIACRIYVVHTIYIYEVPRWLSSFILWLKPMGAAKYPEGYLLYRTIAGNSVEHCINSNSGSVFVIVIKR